MTDIKDIPIIRKNGIELILTKNNTFRVLDKDFEILKDARKYLTEKVEEKNKNNRIFNKGGNHESTR